MEHHEPIDELRLTLGEIHNPYHRAMVCAWLVGLDSLERIEVTLSSIAVSIESLLDADGDQELGGDD